MIRLGIAILVLPWGIAQDNYIPCVVPPVPQEVVLLANVIAKQEGYFSEETLCSRLRNPNCLSYARQAGATEDASGFAIFEDEAAGWTAAIKDILLKQARGMSMDDIIRAKCGPDDDVDLYIEIIRKAGL